MGKLDGKVAVITGATSGMALAGAKLFVDEGAHVFISGRRKDALEEAVMLIGRNVTGVQGDSANLDDLDRLFDTVKQEKGSIDVLWASAGTGAQSKLGEITINLGRKVYIHVWITLPHSVKPGMKLTLFTEIPDALIGRADGEPGGKVTPNR